MFYRRALFYWQFTAAILLPVWVVVGQGLFGGTDGWDLVLYIVLGLILGFAMFVIAGITMVRRTVRTTRSVSSQDALVITLWHAAIIAYGFYSQPLLATAIVILTTVAFWSALYQLFTEARARVRDAFAMPDLVTETGQVDAGHYDAKSPGRGQVIVVEVDEQDEPRR